jgi:hypothetical protein
MHRAPKPKPKPKFFLTSAMRAQMSAICPCSVAEKVVLLPSRL